VGLLESVPPALGDDEFGFAVAGGNVNGSTGYDDVVVGAPGSGASDGEVTCSRRLVALGLAAAS
jgi:hypothetical protein